MMDFSQCKVLYRAARYVFQNADSIETDFCLPSINQRICPYAIYHEEESRDPDICAKCLIEYFVEQERQGAPYADYTD